MAMRTGPLPDKGAHLFLSGPHADWLPVVLGNRAWIFRFEPHSHEHPLRVLFDPYRIYSSPGRKHLLKMIRSL